MNQKYDFGKIILHKKYIVIFLNKPKKLILWQDTVTWHLHVF